MATGLLKERRPVETSSDGVARGRGRRSRWLLVALVLATVLGWVVVGGDGRLGSTSSPSPAAAAPPGASAGAAAAPGTDVSWVPTVGMPLPVSLADGPHCMTRTTTGCFARNVRGAAFAAAHLLVRTFPFAGPGSFEPTIRDHVVGEHRSTLLRLTRQAYADASTAAGVDSGAPLPVPAADAIAGYRVSSPTNPPSGGPDAVQVGLLVRQTEDGGAPSFTEFVVTMRWVGEDWRLEAPAWGDWRSVAHAVTSPGGDFRPYDADGGPR